MSIGNFYKINECVGILDSKKKKVLRTQNQSQKLLCLFTYTNNINTDNRQILSF